MRMPSLPEDDDYYDLKMAICEALSTGERYTASELHPEILDIDPSFDEIPTQVFDTALRQLVKKKLVNRTEFDRTAYFSLIGESEWRIEVACPACGEDIWFEFDDIDEDSHVKCPCCVKTLEFEFEIEEDE